MILDIFGSIFNDVKKKTMHRIQNQKKKQNRIPCSIAKENNK